MTAGDHRIADLYERPRRSWSQETSRHWRHDNPAAGQCGVTALVVHDYIGDSIMKTDVNGAWHYYNFVNGCRYDFSMSQFETPIGYSDTPSNRSEALADTTPEQYELLRSRMNR
jgi:hypothetical protein